MEHQSKRRSPIFALIALALAILIFSGVLDFSAPEKTLQYSDVIDLFENEQVESFVLEGSDLTINYSDADGKRMQSSVTIGDAAIFHSDLDDLIESQYADGTLTSYNYLPQPPTPWYVRILPYVLGGGILLVFFVMMMNRANGGQNGMAQFTRANTHFGTSGSKDITFDDVAGAEEEKAELQQIVEFLRDPDRFFELGARIPKGVLLVGPPGTGKTLLAKAVAGEAGVAFLSISGSDFVELYVGVGASRVRDLFQQAKKVAPAIVFIDEIDAVGRQRGAGLGGGHDEREQTLNQLLVEMDGFGQNEGVIVLAATNRKDILDPALLRPGRFDRQIYIGTPDVKGREAILKVHAKDKPLAEDVDLTVIAKATAGFTGADLQNLLNEGALRAAGEHRPAVTMADLEEAMIKVIAGPEKKSRLVPEHERRLTAYHEAGHAIVMYHLPTQDPVHHITIVPRGMAGGMTISLPTEDTSYLSRNEMFETIVSLLGGRVAEQRKLGDISTGASNDIERATAIARDMAARYGMSERLGPVSYTSDAEVFIGRNYEKTKSYSEQTAAALDDEVRMTLQRAYAQCEKILSENDEKLEALSAYLLEHDSIGRAEFESLMQ